MARPAALLMLADGTSFPGEAIGAAQDAWGEVVFNTSMSGYQEILTDPSYMGQLVNFTFPHIGNYGTNPDDNEAPEPKAAGLICTELDEPHSHWRSQKSLDRWLAELGVSGIAGVDTRALTLHLRKHGCLNGYISSTDLDPASLLEKARALPSMSGLNLADQASCHEDYQFASGHPKTVAVLDFGVKRSILTLLEKAGFSVRVWPGNTSAETILESGAHGVMLSNGPGDPAPCTTAIETVKKLLGRIPIFGICLGHQILALAVGGKTYKLPFGHRGANHPVRDEITGRILVTTQNHGFCVDPESLPEGVSVTHHNANDQTVEGISAPHLFAFSVQHHPEASPGPHDARYPFNQFRELIGQFEERSKNA
ncbi:carbamoyl phosphate synthase small subunit [Deltaproteobacteria bacterium Smac51]|nr:carbamoyl phosphate synthase small subunit [Deltaproteobacteria bacterium Smac51]